MKIAVIGGGLTGLVAALELSKAGHTVQIFEASDEAGGLAAGFPLNGTSLEKTYHHLFLTDTDIRSLVTELGLEDTLKWLPSSMGCFRDGKLWSFGGALDLIRFKPIPFLDRIRMGLTMLYLQKRKQWKDFVQVPAAEWVPAHAGKRAYEVIWKPLLLGKFHQYYNKVSMAWLWARVHIRANSRSSPFARERLGYFRGGFHVLTEALLQTLKERGVQLHLSMPVSSITRTPEGISLTRSTGAEIFDRVVATVPSHVFSKMIAGNNEVEESYTQKLNSIPYLGAICMIFTSSQSLCPYYWVNVLNAENPFLVFVQHTNLTGTEWYNSEHVYYLGTYVPHDHPLFTCDEKELETKFLLALQELVPAFDPSCITQKFLHRLRNAQHVVETDYEQKRPDYTTPVPGVYLSNFSQIFPEDRGTNYSVRDGRNIARIVSENVGRS